MQLLVLHTHLTLDHLSRKYTACCTLELLVGDCWKCALQALLAHANQVMPNMLSPTANFFSPPVQQTEIPRMAYAVNIPSQPRACLPSSIGAADFMGGQGSAKLGSYAMSGVQVGSPLPLRLPLLGGVPYQARLDMVLTKHALLCPDHARLEIS